MKVSPNPYANVMDQTNSKVTDPVKLVRVLRAMYQKSRVGTTFEEEKKAWDNIEAICKKHKINTEIIIMDEEAFKEFSIPVLEYLIQNPEGI